MALIFAITAKTREIVRAAKAGKLRKLASKLYTDDLTSAPEEIKHRDRLESAAHFTPGSDQSRIRIGRRFLRVASCTSLCNVWWPRCADFLVWKSASGEVRLCKQMMRAPPLGDGKEIFTSSHARAILENLQMARAHGGDEPKTLSAAELELWLDRRIRIYGTKWLDELQEQVVSLAARLDWKRERQEFDHWVAAIKGKTAGQVLTTEVMRARAHARSPSRFRLAPTLAARE